MSGQNTVFWLSIAYRLFYAKGIPIAFRRMNTSLARKPSIKGNPNYEFKCHKCPYGGFCAIQRWVYERESKPVSRRTQF